MRAFIAVLLAIAIAFAMPSCREGCKDKNALNYDSKATVENGTCMYCSGSLTANHATYFFVDINAPSPYNNQSTFEFIVSTTNSGYWGNGCQTQNKQTGNVCTDSMWVVNLTNKTASGSFEVFFVQNGIDIWDFQSSVQILPHDTVNLGLVDTACADLTSGVLNNNLFNFQYF
jgi:hypothetical protein